MKYCSDFYIVVYRHILLMKQVVYNERKKDKQYT